MIREGTQVLTAQRGLSQRIPIGGTRVPTSQRALSRRILIGGTRVMMRLGHTKCRNLSKPSNLGIALQVSRQAMAGEVEQDGCRTTSMGVKGFC